MPVISMFYGILIYMYHFDKGVHNIPHIHVKYAEYQAVYDIINNVLLEGNLPINKKRMVEAWIEIHKEDLMADWELAIEGNTLFNIEPLK